MLTPKASRDLYPLFEIAMALTPPPPPPLPLTLSLSHQVGGVGGLFKGLGMRIIMVGTLTGLQWWIYDGFKTAVGINPSAPVKPSAAK